MITARISNKQGTEGYSKDLDVDIANLFLFTQGRVRFGNGLDKNKGENISGEFHTFTTSTANTEVVVPHTLGAVPIGRIVLSQDKAGSLYNSGTSWTSTNIYVKTDGTSVTYKIFLLK